MISVDPRLVSASSWRKGWTRSAPYSPQGLVESSWARREAGRAFQQVVRKPKEGHFLRLRPAAVCRPRELVGRIQGGPLTCISSCFIHRQGAEDLPQLAVVHILGSSITLHLGQAARRQDSSPGTSWPLAHLALLSCLAPPQQRGHALLTATARRLSDCTARL